LRYPREVSEERKSTERAPGKAPAAGLCADCVHARRIESSHASMFILCEKSATDPSYPKYPRLPVITCGGYLRGRHAQETTD
jgi:hypothetical protein